MDNMVKYADNPKDCDRLKENRNRELKWLLPA